MEAEERGWSHRGAPSVCSSHPQRGYSGHSGGVFISPDMIRDQTRWKQLYIQMKKSCVAVVLWLLSSFGQPSVQWPAVTMSPLCCSSRPGSTSKVDQVLVSLLSFILEMPNHPVWILIWVSLKVSTSLPKVVRREEAEIASMSGSLDQDKS